MIGGWPLAASQVPPRGRDRDAATPDTRDALSRLAVRFATLGYAPGDRGAPKRLKD